MDKVLASLFDFSFKRYVTPSLAKYLYTIAMSLNGIIGLALVLLGFSHSLGLGIVSILVAPIAFLFLTGLARVGMETVLSIFRMTNYAAEIARAQRKPNTSDEDDLGTEETNGALMVRTTTILPPPPPGPNK